MLHRPFLPSLSTYSPHRLQFGRWQLVKPETDGQFRKGRMSSNGGSHPSQREKDVIEQQRRLAERLGKKSKPVPSKQRPTATMKAGGLTFKASLPSKTIVAEAPKKPPPRGSSSSDASKVNRELIPAQKRPTRPGLKRHSSATSVLAAARAKAAARTDNEETPVGTKPKDSSTAIISSGGSPKLKRKTKTAGASTSSRLANLVQNVASNEKGSEDDMFTSAAFASNLSPESFWKNLRDWNFVTDLARQQQQEHVQDGSKAADEQHTPSKKPIPDTFISFRHYISLWAPLCLAETRAQLLSEALTESGQNTRRSPFISVKVETTWKGGKKGRGLHTDLIDIDSCHVQLKAQDRENNSGQFYANDVFCLVPTEHKDMVERLLRGGKINSHEDSLKKFGLIGHTEVQRKEVNGLILKVAKRKWALIGCPQMFLLRIGGNITALREFTALCGVETTPLKRYLLGHHLEKNNITTYGSKKAVAPPIQKETLLKKMGGVEALGKGFTEYAQRKFNPSQLMAISASAQGYGDGGFTLIKGPPGTGSKFNCLPLHDHQIQTLPSS